MIIDSGVNQRADPEDTRGLLNCRSANREDCCVPRPDRRSHPPISGLPSSEHGRPNDAVNVTGAEVAVASLPDRLANCRPSWKRAKET